MCAGVPQGGPERVRVQPHGGRRERTRQGTTALCWTALTMVYRDEDSILDHVYEKQIFSAFYYEDLKF